MMIPLLLALALATGYLLLLSRRLSPATPPRQTQSEDHLESISYHAIDLLHTVPPPTQKHYTVIGGSGAVGSHLVRLLLRRGELPDRLTVLDTAPLPEELEGRGVKWVRCDITDYEQVREGLQGAQVVFLTAAAIRYFERSPSTKRNSYLVNVLGTQNVIKACQSFDSSPLLIFTSSWTVAARQPNFFPFFEERQRDPYVVTDQEIYKGEKLKGWYPESKREGDRLVREANGVAGLITAVLRPGASILHPGTLLFAEELPPSSSPSSKNPIKPPTSCPSLASDRQTALLCVWDYATANLLLEQALTTEPEKVAGQAFLVTGADGRSPLTSGEIRGALRFYVSWDLKHYELPTVPLFIISFLIEAVLTLRYHLLHQIAESIFLPTSFLPTAKTLSAASYPPQWMVPMARLQPAAWGVILVDSIIDDTRAREMLGFEPQWSSLQGIRWLADEYEGIVHDKLFK